MIYRATYQSMTAFYGPCYIEADDEQQAKHLFAKGTFRPEEYGLIEARPVSLREAMGRK